MDELKTKQQVVEKIKEASKILVTVSDNPSVDALSAALALTLLFDKQEKYATSIFSGETPPAIAFLEPEKTFDDTTDSLRDFIIALNKEKADHLRYKVEGDSVKIFITPYKTTIDQSDLEFSQGDYNVELVIALGVDNQEHLDKALEGHGQILHDAAIITMTAGEQTSDLGGIDWHDANASSLSEMVAGLSEALKTDKKKPLIDAPMATALLTGIVAETDRFSNEHTTSRAMTIAATLMSAGADQQLIANELQAAQTVEPVEAPAAEEATEDEAEESDVEIDNANGTLTIKDHDPSQLEIEHDETLAELDRRVRGEEGSRKHVAEEVEMVQEEAAEEEAIEEAEQAMEKAKQAKAAPAEAPVDAPVPDEAPAPEEAPAPAEAPIAEPEAQQEPAPAEVHDAYAPEAEELPAEPTLETEAPAVEAPAAPEAPILPEPTPAPVADAPAPELPEISAATAQPQSAPLEPAYEETPIPAVGNAYALDEVSEPTFSGTLNATTEQAADDSRREIESSKNHTILSHAYLGSNDGTTPGSTAVSGVGSSDESAPSSFDGPGLVGQASAPGAGEEVHSAYALEHDAGAFAGERVIQPLGDQGALAQPAAPATPTDLGLPLPPPVPDFSQMNGGPALPLPPTGQQPAILGDILTQDAAPTQPAPIDYTANAVAAPDSAYAIDTSAPTLPPVQSQPQAPATNSNDPGQFQIPTGQ